MVGALVAALDNPLDLLALLILAVLIFGKQLPEVARSLGKGIREFRESVDLGEVGEAIQSVNQVRNAVSPGAMARAAFPRVGGPADAAVASDAVSPLEPAVESAHGAASSPEAASAPPGDETPGPAGQAGS